MKSASCTFFTAIQSVKSGKEERGRSSPSITACIAAKVLFLDSSSGSPERTLTTTRIVVLSFTPNLRMASEIWNSFVVGSLRANASEYPHYCLGSKPIVSRSERNGFAVNLSLRSKVPDAQRSPKGRG